MFETKRLHTKLIAISILLLMLMNIIDLRFFDLMTLRIRSNYILVDFNIM